MGGILQVDTIQNNNATTLITQTNSTTLTFGVSGQNIVIPSGVTFNTASATISVPPSIITGQTAETSIAGGDSILIYDDSATALRKMTRTNFVAGLGGLTEADQWRITADLSLANDVDTVISANLERVDTDGFALLGTGMTQSSGVFTFPSTGYWYVSFNARGTGTTVDPYAFCILQTTTDGTNFDNASQSSASVPVANHFFNVSGNFIFDCTNTTTHKVRFRQYANTSNSKFLGDTDVSNTYFTFIKLAET